MTVPADSPVFESADPRLALILADLKRIAAMEDGALRNLFITQRYQDISDTTKTVLGSENLNWCTYACWASKTAGESIRGEELPDVVEAILKHEGIIEKSVSRIRGWLGFSKAGEDLPIFDDVRSVLKGVSTEIAFGNLKVYAEIAPLFSRFAVELGQSTDAPSGLNEEAWENFASILRPGKPDEYDGQDYLKAGFREYYEARFVADASQRAQKIFYANVLVGLHEQTRLQSAIKNAMAVPAIEGFDQILFKEATNHSPGVRPDVVAAKVRKIPDRVKLFVIDIWEHIATRVAMELVLPQGGSVDLSRDVPPVGRKMYPGTLVSLDYPPLLALAGKYVENLASTEGSGAKDWSELKQRMNFIFHLFRANAQNIQLYAQPFLETQRADFNEGRMPSNRSNL
jgi:hypothetical protein